VTRRAHRWSAAALLLALLGAGLASAAEGSAALDKDWRGIAARGPRLSARGVVSYALEGVAAGQPAERIEAALALAGEMQDRDPASPTYGNLRWYFADPRPDDLNAVQFCLQQATLIWLLHRDRLTPSARAELRRLLEFGREGVRRHRVREGYTNIYLMKCWNLLAVGACLADPAAAAEGQAALASWWGYTQTNGITEYLSPTYYGTDLDSLALMARHAPQEPSRAIARAALALFWLDIASNWFEPGQRLGGSHGRDYDYRTGRGYLDGHLRRAGWLADSKPAAAGEFVRQTETLPPPGLRDFFSARTPRTLIRRWGEKPEQTAVHYVGRTFSIGSAGAGTGPEDKVFVVNFPGGPDTVVGNFVMDGRGDAYGASKEVTGGGHMKSHHLRAFVVGAQRGPEVLLLAADDAAVMKSGSITNPTRCLLSHFVFPLCADVWVGDSLVKPPAPARPVDVPPGETVFLRVGRMALALRFVVARDTAGGPAPVRWINDGSAHRASRLTAVHAEGPPTGVGCVVLWARGAEGLDDAGFAAFRAAARAETMAVQVSGATVDVATCGMRLQADVVKRRRLLCAGGEERSGASPLQMRYPVDSPARPLETFFTRSRADHQETP
jgi:hypothetical protein